MITEDTIEGDIIAIVHGSFFPIILRRMDEESKRMLCGLEDMTAWRMIGTAYVHGIMAGEAWNDIEDGKRTEQTIYLV